MQTVRQLITDTRKWKNLVGTDLEKNARLVSLYDWKVIESMDVDGDIFRDVSCKAITNRKGATPHLVEMRFYGDDQYGAKAWVACSCPYFLYHAEVALYDKDSSDIQYSNGADPVIKNPSKIPIICKHLLSALRSGAVKRPITKSLVKKQLEIERKEREAKEKEKAKKLKEREAAKKKAIEQARKDREKIKKEREKQLKGK